MPSLAIGNFTWDWIYGVYPAFDRARAGRRSRRSARAYAAATRALRLPLHGGFEPMAAVTRTSRSSRGDRRAIRAETRRLLGLAGDRPVVLPSFGGHGATLPLEALRRSDRFTLLGPFDEPPAGLLYQDLVAAADVVVSKPGYGIVSECVANGAALLYTSRGRFIEYDLFVARDAAPAALPATSRRTICSRDAGPTRSTRCWRSPRRRATASLDGAAVAAREVARAGWRLIRRRDRIHADDDQDSRCSRRSRRQLAAVVRWPAAAAQAQGPSDRRVAATRGASLTRSARRRSGGRRR